MLGKSRRPARRPPRRARRRCGRRLKASTALWGVRFSPRTCRCGEPTQHSTHTCYLPLRPSPRAPTRSNSLNTNPARRQTFCPLPHPSQAAEQDVDKDGLTDIIDVRVTARGLQGYSVHSVKMLMTFDYQLNVRATLDLPFPRGSRHRLLIPPPPPRFEPRPHPSNPSFHPAEENIPPDAVAGLPEPRVAGARERPLRRRRRAHRSNLQGGRTGPLRPPSLRSAATLGF